MDKPVERENVLTNLRSVAQSMKGGVPVDRLQEDYKSILGVGIPFRELGYRTLDGFLRDIPEVIRLEKGSDGRLMALGVADSSTAHIVSLVSRQKAGDARRGKRGRKAPLHYAARVPRYPTRRSGYTPTYAAQKFNKAASFPSSKQFPSRRSPPRRSPPREKSPPPHRNLRPQRSPPPERRSPSPPPQRSPPPPSRPVYKKPEVATVQSDSSHTNASLTTKGPSSYRRSNKPEIAPRFLRLLEQQNKQSRPTEDNWLLPTPSAPDVKPKVPEALVPLRKLQVHIKNVPNAADREADLSEALNNARNAKEYVKIYAEANRMPLSYKTDRIGQKRKGYLSKLFLGEKTFKSYPEDASTPEAAEEEAAKKAMTDIQDSRAHLALHPETAYGNAEEIQTLLGRIEEIVWEKPSGMFTNGIISEYESKYQERLPSCWMDLLKESSAVEIEALEIECGNVPKGAQFIVRPSKEASSGNVTPSSSSSKSEFPSDGFDTKALQKNLVEISVPHVDEIQIPAGNEWQLYICCVKDVIFARLLDYDEDFCVLSDEMKEFYHLKKYPVKDVFESQVYAICEDDPNIWHRAIAVEIREDLVWCYLVDVGEFVTVEKENIQEIFPSFLALPFQAFMINLDGLEDYETSIKLEFLESNFLGRTLIAEVRRWWPVPDWLPENSGIHKVGYSVVLYDTSDNEDINMNDYLKGIVLSSLPSELPKQSISSCGYLTHITPEGKIYVRFSHPEANLLELELEKFVTTFEVSALRKSIITPETVYVAKCCDGKWHRVVVSEQVDPDSSIIEVCLMDFGNTESVSSSNICELEPVCPYLVSVPSQAITCELFDALPSPNAAWTEMATLKLREMAPAHEEIMIRVMFAQDDNNLPKVNLYKRNKDSEIVTINHTLCSRPELFNLEPIAPPKVPSTLPLNEHRYQASKNFPLFKDIPDVALPAEVQMAKKVVSTSSPSDQINWLMTPDTIKSPEGYEDQSPISLSPPEIPPKGKVFDVMVSLAAHPHNFIIQPLSTWNNLTNLGRKMEEFYNNEENYCEMHLSLLKENNYYAALHADGCWYRVCLQNIIPGDPIMAVVYYVDYGEISPVSMSNLQPLYSKFKQLPCQAIKASLYGVKPLEIDWDPIHCIKFKEMVENKTFVALVEDFLAKTDPVFPSLRISLVDTSIEDEDIYVHKILVESGIARMA